MSQFLETKWILTTKSVELFTNHLIVKKHSPFESSQFELSYEQIESKKSVESKINFGLLVIASFGAIVGFLYMFGNTPEISLLFYSISLVLVFIAFGMKQNLVIIKSFTGQNIELYFSSRNKNEIIDFADKIVASANSYLLNKYSRIDKDLPREPQLQNLVFLRDRELLSEEKFEQLKNQLLGRDNQSAIGYR